MPTEPSPPSAPEPLLVFRLDDRRFALRLAPLQRVLPALEITPLPDAPGVVAGIVDVAGRIVPVLDLRRRFALPSRETRLSDVLILVEGAERAAALAADGVDGLIDGTQPQTAAGAIVAGLKQVDGVVELEDGLALIHDIDRFLSACERQQLDAALAARPA